MDGRRQNQELEVFEKIAGDVLDAKEVNEFVIPAKAGIHKLLLFSKWMPAFAGMTIISWFRRPKTPTANFLSLQIAERIVTISHVRESPMRDVT